jgi:hypothetical protein
MNWDALGFAITVVVALGGMLMVWHKFSAENAIVKAEVEDHREKIAIILIEKANCADVLKLGRLMDSMQEQMITHHLDAAAHRNRDFEARMNGIAESITEFVRDNRKDHENIIQMIKELIK